MKILDFKRKKSQNSNTACAVQTSIASNHPYYNLSSYMPINGESRVYAELRNAVPILDSAINKIVRLCEGFKFNTGNEKVNDMMNSYFESINVGGNQKGIASFISNYLNQLLTFGTAIGEIVMCDDGIYALYNSELSSIELKRAPNGVDIDFYNYGNKISKPNLILYSVLNPKPAELCGTSLLSGLPFVSDILLEIYNTIGENWTQALSGLPGLASRWHLVSNRGRQSMASLTGSSSIWIRASTPLCRTSSGEVQEVSVRTSRSQSGSSWLSAISRSWYTRSRDAMVSGTCSTSFSRRAGPAASACWNA